jgi:hypothetical protein
MTRFQRFADKVSGEVAILLFVVFVIAVVMTATGGW